MYLDKNLAFSEEQAVTSTAASTNVVDLGVARQIGIDGSLDIAITVTEAAAATGAATVVVTLQESSDNSTFTDVVSSAAIGKATLVAGYQFFMKVPADLSKRYLRMNYTVATGPLTAGKFSAHMVDGIQKSKSYADAI